MLKRILRYLGFEKQTPYVRDYFYATNMKASIYMSIVVIVLEVWMIIRTTNSIFKNNLQSQFNVYFDKYYKNYIILLSAGIIMLIYALRFVLGKKDNRIIGNAIKWGFAIICIYFGIKISLQDYEKGEQMLTFLTMIMFAVCLLIWRPLTGFLILTVSYGIYYWQINGITPINVKYDALIKGIEPANGTTLATDINLFTMWLSTLLFCISNYNKILSQATKDENLEEINSYLSRISVEDELTGIHNMVYFRAEAEKLMSYVTTDKNSIVFLFFDIENFKSYNEQYGFHKGNELLIEFAHLIETSFHGSLVSRFSDDHFVVLTKQEGSMEIISSLAEHIHDMQGEVQLTLKCGAYKPINDETDPSLACDRARFACNSIKKHFDRSFRLYDKSLEDRFELKQYIVNNIDNAIANGYIKVFYQPVVSTSTGCICGMEALARWHDPKYGLLPPGAFIGILEEYRQIYKLDRCIIEQVCRDYRTAADNKRPFVPVSLNFSRLDFELCDIVGFLTAAAEKYNVPPKYLEVEITESALTDQQDFLESAMKILRTSGFNIWLDDFGSGYSSLNVLKDYQFDVMKIDMKFLSGFNDNEKTRMILKNIVALTKQLNMISLTEGVETQEQYDFLKSIGCDLVQGYLFSKPLPKSDICEMIQSNKFNIAPEFIPA